MHWDNKHGFQHAQLPDSDPVPEPVTEPVLKSDPEPDNFQDSGFRNSLLVESHGVIQLCDKIFTPVAKQTFTWNNYF